MGWISEEKMASFQTLTEEDKIIRLEEAVHLLMEIGNRHVELFKRHRDSATHKEIGFVYFYPTIENAWENVKFSLFLGEGHFRHFNFYPARLICEHVFRLEYYISQDKTGQNEICLWEMMRIAKRFYAAFGDEVFKKHYERIVEEFNESGKCYPDIEEDRAYRDPFPKMNILIEGSKLPTAKNFYKHYQVLCEGHHGKLLSLYIAKNEIAQYRRNLFYIFLFCKWLLIIADDHINRVTRDIVSKAIREVDEMVFAASK